MIDFTSKFGRVVKRHLNEEYFVWLTTVGSDLTPQPRPVWFIWDKDSFLIFSQAKAYKLKHISQHPKVAMHFNAGDERADEGVIVIIGEAFIDQSAPPAHKLPAYLKKYKTGIAGLGNTPEEFSREYSVAIRVTPTSLRGW